jgi:uncharacterized protein
MNILIAGGTGLVGFRLSHILRGMGHTVHHLSRRANPKAEFPAFAWDIEKETLDINAFQNADYIINLAGSGIVDKRWTAARKKDIIDSRVQSTLLLKKYLTTTPNKVKAYISASAIGYYGDRQEALLMEDAAPADKGFLSESTIAWEKAVGEIANTGLRTVAIRIGIVMSTQGGAMEKMLIPFMFRLGVYFGNGQQWYSWIHIEDLCHIFVWAIENDKAQGIYNGVAPNPLTNYDLTKAMATAKGGFHILLPAPSVAMRIGMGEMADTVLGSTKVSSQKIENQGFTFKYPTALEAIKDLLARKI